MLLNFIYVQVIDNDQKSFANFPLNLKELSKSYKLLAVSGLTIRS